MLHTTITREHPREGLSYALILKENKTGTNHRETSRDFGIETVWRTVVDRAGLIDSDRNSDISYKRIPVARVSILDGKGEPE